MRALLKEIEAIPVLRRFGRVSRIEGLLVEVTGAAGAISLGGQVRLTGSKGKQIPCEVVGFRDGRALVMPLGVLDGVSLGARADFYDEPAQVFPSGQWLGRVVDAFGKPTDGKGPLVQGTVGYPLRASAPSAHSRSRVGGKLDLGIRALNAFATCAAGQRMGIFAGSGVGKSTLLAMLARNTNADAIVIGLVGERGRELKEFIEDDLGEAGLARSVVVAATSDEPALVRRQAAFMAMAIAEQLRDQGLHVLLLMDSVTRFAMAQREVGLSAGEPPASKGYTPTVFAELPRLLERAGPGHMGCSGSITGLFTVLVEGDDHNEPIADAVRGILDGHIVLERAIAERGRFPAINILKSVSRVMPGCNTSEEQDIVMRARAPLATYEDMAELIRLGAYKAGTNAEVDAAIRLQPQLEAFLSQKKDECSTLTESYAALEAIVGAKSGKGS
jgi:flagellum-specific ATP synthase